MVMDEVTRILSTVDAGDLHAPDQLLPLVNDELRRLRKNAPSCEALGLLLTLSCDAVQRRSE